MQISPRTVEGHIHAALTFLRNKLRHVPTMLPVSGSQLQQALGSDTVNQLAQKFGVDANQASEMLAKILSNLVDHATLSFLGT